MSMIEIDGVTLPTPSTYSLPQQDLDSESSGRNERGVLQRDRLREGVYKIDLEWWAIDNSKLQRILSTIRPAKLSVKFITHTGYERKTMYVGDRNVEMVRFMNSRNNMAWNISFSLVEY